MANKNTEFDIITIGAGPAGLAFAKLLSEIGLKIAIIEKSPLKILKNPPQDGRDIALTHLSIELLKKIGVWQNIPESEIGQIKKAKVLNGDEPYVLNFDSKDTSRDFLGCIISNHIIRKASFKAVSKLANITIIDGIEVISLNTDSCGAEVVLADGRKLKSKLAVAADSRFSNMRRKMGIASYMNDFGRTVIVCQMEHENPHNNIAYECFHYGRTLAVLPLVGNKSSIVITISSDKTDALMNMSKEEFNIDIQERFENRLGKMNLIGKKYAYPLMGVYAKKFVKTRFALIGDAAVGMHPVTAHGYNLGLKGANILASEIRKANNIAMDIGGDLLLQRYQKKHRIATAPLYFGTNSLVKLYTEEGKTAKLLRKTMLRLGNKLSPVKRLITSQLTEIKSI